MTDKEVFIRLSNAITEWRIAYYKPHIVHESWAKSFVIEDKFYDEAATLYKTLAQKLGQPPTALQSTDIDETRGSIAVAIGKLMNPMAVAGDVTIKPKAILTKDELVQIFIRYHRPKNNRAPGF